MRSMLFAQELIFEGEAEGVILHSNTMADLDYKAYVAAIEKLEAHGYETVADL